MAEPRFFTRNFLNVNCDITVSSGDAFKHRLYDKDKNSTWVTSGENSDATESSVIVVFKEGEDELERTIDTVILLNHNLEDPILEYWNGSAWTSLDSETDLTSGVATVMEFNAVVTSRIRVRNSQTITTNQEKFIGELIACAVQLEFANDLNELAAYDVSVAQKSFEIMLGDGSTHRTTVKHSPNRSSKFQTRIRVDYVEEEDLETLIAIRDAGSAFLFQPESTSRPDEVYLCHLYSFSYKYVSTSKAAGFQISLDIREV